MSGRKNKKAVSVHEWIRMRTKDMITGKTQTPCSHESFPTGVQRLTVIRHSVEIVLSSVEVHLQIVCSYPQDEEFSGRL